MNELINFFTWLFSSRAVMVSCIAQHLVVLICLYMTFTIPAFAEWQKALMVVICIFIVFFYWERSIDRYRAK